MHVADPIDIFDALESLIREYPDQADPGTGWLCCDLVARLVLFASHRPFDRWHGTDWWGRAMVYDPAKPYSAVQAMADLVREDRPGTSGAIRIRLRPTAAVLHADIVEPILAVGGWWVVQGWRLSGTGHTFLVNVDVHGTVRVVESSTRWGVRVARRAWTGGPLPRGEDLVHRLSEYGAGVGIRHLWGSL